MTDQSTPPPERRRHQFSVWLPANCTNPEYSIRKLIGDDHGGTVMIEHVVVADMTEEQYLRLIHASDDLLKGLRASVDAVDVHGVLADSRSKIVWRSVMKCWQYLGSKWG